MIMRTWSQPPPLQGAERSPPAGRHGTL